MALSPKNFTLPNTIGGTATFVDFKDAQYFLTYDVANKKASYKAVIRFTQSEEGKPIFDVVKKPLSIKLNDEFLTEQEVATPNAETKIRILDKTLQPGNYTFTIEGDIQELVKFDTNSVSAAHWTSDLDDRAYLENYLPTNLEYDQYQMTMFVKILGTDKPHTIYANGIVETIKNGLSFKLTYPKYFTASSGFYHLAPLDAFKEVKLNFESISGANIPVTIYGKASSTDFASYSKKTLTVLRELEKDYGSFPHPAVLVYNSGRGGMEYCGATMTELWALEHELTHSYFARGIVPANGNAGWIDEAIASWRDDGYQRSTTMSGSSRMSGHAYYTRKTDRDAYSFGASFMSYLDGKIAQNIDPDGLKSFLKNARENYLFTPYTVEAFVGWMDQFYNFDFSHDFKTYTYGADAPTNTSAKTQAWGKSLEFLKSHPIHLKLGVKELFKFL